MTTSPNLTAGVDPAYHPDPSCAVAHGAAAAAPTAARTMVLVFAGETARYMCRFGRDLGFTSVLVEPDPALAQVARAWADTVVSSPAEATADAGTDVVVTDHHRDELGLVLKDALELPAVRWIGVVGNPRVRAPHLDLLADLGVDESQVARIHRPIGLNIGSRTPAEIALSTLAGLLADRAGKPGGFTFP